MSGFHHLRGTSDASRAAVDRLRREVWEANPLRQHLPDEGLVKEGKPALTGIDPSRVGKYVVVTVRDPLGSHDENAAALELARAFGPAEKVGSSGLFQVYTAQAEGFEVSVVATGSGSPEIELAMIELLDHSDADVYVYFGTAAGIHPYVAPGDVIVSTGVVRDEGMTAAYVDPSYPAAPAFDVVAAFAAAAQGQSITARLGVTRSIDSDPLGNGRPSVAGFQQPHHAAQLSYWTRVGVLNNDREGAAVVTLGNLFGRRTGVVLGVTDNYPYGMPLEVGAGMVEARAVLVDGIRRLHEMDAQRDAAGAAFWSPALGEQA